jgi:hypothetical protein
MVESSTMTGAHTLNLNFKGALIVIDFKHWKLDQNHSKRQSNKIFIQDMQKSKTVPSMQGWRSSPISVLSSRRIMVLMASFVLSQSVLSSMYSAYARIRIQKEAL